MSSIRTIGLKAHHKKKGAAEALNEVSSYIESKGLTCIIDQDTALNLGWKGQSMPMTDFLKRSDLILSLGGDGALLHLASSVAPLGIPLGGVNLGRLGFLTATSWEDFRELIASIVAGTYKIEERAMLQASLVVNGNENCMTDHGKFLALNEVAIVRAKPGRMVNVETFINGEFLTNYHADGLLVATASGSTAYSLSAGGPIVTPGSGVLCLTPICPHSLTNRSLIVPNTSLIEIRPRQNDEGEFPLIFAIDGNEVATLGRDTTLQVEKASYSLKIVRLPDYSFPELLRAKLNWRGAEV